MTGSSRPRATLEDVWRERDAWARAAREGKRKQESSRMAALTLGVAGALLGTVAGFASSLDSPEGVGRTLGVLSAILIALGGYFGRELLTPERESRWARARLLVEAWKRECWRYVMGVPPYDGPSAHRELRTRVEEMARNRGLERPPTLREALVEPPSPASIGDYLDQRVLEQAEYYEQAAAGHRIQRDRLTRLTFVLGAAAVVLGIVGSALPSALAFVPVVTTATAAVVAWIQGNRVGATIPLYQETASQLRLLAAAWRDSESERAGLTEAERRAAEIQLVERCEEIMARENGAWRAEWLSEEKAQEAFEALGKVEEAARGAGSPGGGGGTETR